MLAPVCSDDSLTIEYRRLLEAFVLLCDCGLLACVADVGDVEEPEPEPEPGPEGAITESVLGACGTSGRETETTDPALGSACGGCICCSLMSPAVKGVAIPVPGLRIGNSSSTGFGIGIGPDMVPRMDWPVMDRGVAPGAGGLADLKRPMAVMTFVSTAREARS